MMPLRLFKFLVFEFLFSVCLIANSINSFQVSQMKRQVPKQYSASENEAVRLQPNIEQSHLIGSSETQNKVIQTTSKQYDQDKTPQRLLKGRRSRREANFESDLKTKETSSDSITGPQNGVSTVELLDSDQEKFNQSIPAAFASFEAAFQGECSRNNSTNNPCDHICLDLHDGTYECSCFYGFALAVDGYSCTQLTNLDSTAAVGPNRPSPDETSGIGARGFQERVPTTSRNITVAAELGQSSAAFKIAASDGGLRISNAVSQRELDAVQNPNCSEPVETLKLMQDGAIGPPWPVEAASGDGGAKADWAQRSASSQRAVESLERDAAWSKYANKLNGAEAKRTRPLAGSENRKLDGVGRKKHRFKLQRKLSSLLAATGTSTRTNDDDEKVDPLDLYAGERFYQARQDSTRSSSSGRRVGNGDREFELNDDHENADGQPKPIRWLGDESSARSEKRTDDDDEQQFKLNDVAASDDADELGQTNPKRTLKPMLGSRTGRLRRNGRPDGQQQQQPRDRVENEIGNGRNWMRRPPGRSRAGRRVELRRHQSGRGEWVEEDGNWIVHPNRIPSFQGQMWPSGSDEGDQSNHNMDEDDEEMDEELESDTDSAGATTRDSERPLEGAAQNPDKRQPIASDKAQKTAHSLRNESINRLPFAGSDIELMGQQQDRLAGELPTASKMTGGDGATDLVQSGLNEISDLDADNVEEDVGGGGGYDELTAGDEDSEREIGERRRVVWRSDLERKQENTERRLDYDLRLLASLVGKTMGDPLMERSVGGGDDWPV